MEETNAGSSIRSLFGRNLRRLRSIANKSQLHLAAEADLAHNFINDIESGKKWVSARTLAKLSQVLKAEPYQFFIADSKWDSRGAEIFSLYLDDFSDSMEKIVNEYRYRYLPENAEKKAHNEPGK